MPPPILVVEDQHELAGIAQTVPQCQGRRGEHCAD
jgi:hypothetical protein